ncbi:DinB family protein [Cytophagaceae bacterium YF14B1]|uniref:DinB family protein n=1 Tax=Xanthocytophaga flava TaxID=3048013 RepID=A0AAE3QNJ0_9BACT|nr:DinB family protein [Xanthocytophaga flavus]MDJ1481956.1 DinB family protein [Xanthocytophaga flavus]
MNNTQKLEVWLRGPLPDVPPLLQPVAHALLQAQEEIHTYLKDFPDTLLWECPGGVASVGFHLQHLAGILDRLFTYARGQALTEQQLHSLSLEGKSPTPSTTTQELLQAFDTQLIMALDQLCTTKENTLTEVRGVGRGQVPSTVLGLLFHAAEHTQRHVGQLLVTAKVLVVTVSEQK